MIKCSKCDKRNKLNFKFDICTIDAIGYFVICLILIFPFWGLTKLYLMVEAGVYPIILIVSAIIAYKRKFLYLAAFFLFLLVAYPFDLLSNFWEYFVPFYPIYWEKYLPIFGFLIGYYRVSHIPYKFLTLLVNYKLDATLLCPSCNHVAYELKLPSNEEPFQ
jgi:glucan phosphoethanolaminetransferase (alkaline phosphatase superfamily)